MNIRSLLEQAYRAALEAAGPARLLAPHLKGERPDFILAFGKAALPMARAALAAYPGVETLVIAPRGTENLELPGSATLMLSSHPVPDASSVTAAEAALERLGALREDQQALVLVSGGGSALMAAPDGVTLEQKQALTRELLRAGADIGEINTVRRHLSRSKGGRLAAATRAQVTALLISDVVGDDPSVIASGPTVPDATTFAEALAVLDRYSIAAPATRQHFQAGVDGKVPETPDRLPHVTNTIIGSNRHLLEAAQAYIQGQGVRAVILSDSFEGEARELARAHAALVRSVEKYGDPVKPPVVLLSGGEATVTLRGDGVGGRNLEFALALLLALGEDGLHALSAGSDGVDGSSPAAGAFLTPGSRARARAAGLEARDFLERNDSGSFFAALGDTLVTGPSGHNLNDLRLIAVGFTED
ncbi:hydroxypyruvate reductase, putative [Deinococcus aerolatus]|uniref:Hydroxypyruvate reductase, putative n=1 Tax=Deinococcus aerolatus TaxID=522487 RepID=A0ABQ2GF87_9DEIO|nr:glycerate kinase [Deinococcus aerolatus]GGL92091.1 hydroxypyruvate reductase, putative [Deinococcus aerolatus]